MKTFNYKERELIRMSYKNWKPRTDPYWYFPNIISYLTPIELNIWHIIRIYWLPFYMQYPVLDYFIDFADPIKKIWIEVDWKEWHLDKEKDKKRQIELEKEWWTIIRIDWKDTYNELKFIEEEDENWNIYEKEEYWTFLTNLFYIYKT